MSKLTRSFVDDNKGATAIEYGLIVAVLSLAIVVGIGALGENLTFLWSDNNSRLVQALEGGDGS
ncbi:Flp family type IVb pilin [Kumtagia ephedrae]|jgi:pilus assembly protein Flp/PilA|uniref:Flp family type IVb pilin n=1 Tax=Kumtagia ephedrae TaxID=2116701 RepID=A0A2P7RKN9_9HYPH|nr:Flp family type IVb pilin [Mesorhizobium ephedrae]PSJ50784.1 Flp family type IVb pilin [Mesorhizobium ephedrae]